MAIGRVRAARVELEISPVGVRAVAARRPAPDDRLAPVGENDFHAPRERVVRIRPQEILVSRNGVLLDRERVSLFGDAEAIRRSWRGGAAAVVSAGSKNVIEAPFRFAACQGVCRPPVLSCTRSRTRAKRSSRAIPG